MATREPRPSAAGLTAPPLLAGDRRFFRRWTALAMTGLAFPYVVLAIFHPPGMTFTGMLYSPSDNVIYTAQLLHAHLGDWLWHDYFTFEQVTPKPVFLFYTLVGKLTPGLTGPVAMALVEHALRLVLAFLFVQQCWRFYGEALRERASRRVAFLFLLFTSGLGVLLQILPGPLRLQEQPFDLLFPYSSSFYGLLYPPHFAAILLLMVVFLRALMRALTVRRAAWKPAVLATLAIAGVSLIHPDTAATLCLAAVLWLGWHVFARPASSPGPIQAAWRTALAIGGAIPFAAYSGIASLTDSVIASGIRDASPPPVPDPVLFYGLGYGIPLLCALATLPRLIRSPRRVPPGMVLLWSVVLASLLLLPITVVQQSHALEGLQMVLAALAGVGLTRRILPRLWRSNPFRRLAGRRPLGYSRRRLRLLTINLVVIFSSTSVMAISLASPRAGLTATSELYLTSDDEAALSWMLANVDHNDVVIGGPETASFVAAYGGARVAFGNPYFTPHYRDEARALFLYLRGEGNPADYLGPRSVRWLYFGPREAELARFDPRSTSYLAPAFTRGQTIIYRVTR